MEYQIPRKQGFAAMTEEKRKEIARKGGHAVQSRGVAHKLSYEERSRGGKQSSGNFKFRPEAAKEAGRKGGKAHKQHKTI